MRRPTLVLALALAANLGACSAVDSEPAALDANPVQIAATQGFPRPDSLRPQLAPDRFVAGDGAELPLRAWLPQGRPSAIILALHGFNDYSNAFALPAAGLLARGIGVYAYDQRGFGAAPRHGRWSGQDAMVEDAALAATLLRRRYPELPIYLLGESMGGAVAILTATRDPHPPIDGVILSAPAVWGRQTMTILERAGLWFAGFVPAMHLPNRAIPVEIHPSDNIQMLRALGADPLVIKTTRSDSLNGLVDLMGAALQAAPRLDIPALVLYGERDQIVPRAPMSQFVGGLPGATRSDQRVALYANGYHMLLRDLQAAVVLSDIAAWIGDHHAALPSGADRSAGTVLTAAP